MEVKQIISELDQEIARLKEARALLAGESSRARRPGRPAGKTKTAAAAKSATSSAAPRKGKKRNLSPEGRRRIQEALRRRWAAQRKTSAKGDKSAKAEKAAAKAA